MIDSEESIKKDKIVIKSKKYSVIKDKKEPVITNKKGPVVKTIKYKKERIEILQKLNNILGITKTNNKFYICDLSEDKQKEICDLKEYVKKYFHCNRNRIFAKNEIVKKEYLSIIKIIFKYMDVDISLTRKVIDKDGEKINTGIYFVDFK